MGKSRSYIPVKGSNQATAIMLSNKIEKLNEKIEKIEQIKKQEYRALQDFVRLLTNFASHDIKNAIHNMDGMLSTMDAVEVRQEDLDALKSCLDNIRNSLQEFKVLSSDVEKGSFKLSEIESALKSLHRPLFRREKVIFDVTYLNISKSMEVKQTFHPILQVLNNLVINAFEFLDGANRKEIKIIISQDDLSKNVVYRICDTGTGIPEKNKSKIFEAYFTTKDKGSGVGLTHVKHVLNKIKGSVELVQGDPNFSTIFEIKIPFQ